MAESENHILFSENLELVDYLKKSRLFGHVSDKMLKRLEPLSEIVKYPAGIEILIEGHENDKVYFLMRGEVEIFAKGESILTLKRKGDLFGEMSTISSKPCSATVISKTPVTVFTIAAKNVGKYTDIEPGEINDFFYRVFAMILTEKLTLTTAKARQYESTNRLLEDTKRSLEQKIIEQKQAEENRLQLEAQLRHSQKLEAIGTLAGGIAHDFNNLLFTMLGYITMAKDDLPDDSQVKKDLEESLVAAKRAKDLVQQILTFSRHQEGERKPIQITPLIRETVKFIRSSLPSTVEIKQIINDDHGIILGDPSQIHQVIMNLCTNAGHAMKDTGGVLMIELDQTCIDSRFAATHNIKVGDYLVMSVSDTGSGISSDIIDRIFDPFFTTKPVGEGSGMGLAVVHGIIKNYEGTILVKTKEGKGTQFDVYLPIIPNIPLSTSSEDRSVYTGSEHIMVIDDESSITNLMKRILDKSGYQVTATNSSSEALQLFQSDPDTFDLIITDQTMPRLTGLILAKEVLKLRPNMKIIITTGYGADATMKEAQKAGIVETVNKPIEYEQLTKIIRNALDKN